MGKKSIFLAMLVVFGVAGVPPATYGQVENLILNPSFEEDEVILDDPAWEQWATWGYETGLSSTVEIDENEFIDGTRSLRVIPTGDTNWYFIVLNLPILVDEDKDYTISFWAKAEEERPLTVQLKATDNSINAWGATTFDLTTEWAEYHYASEVLIDDVKLEILCSGSEAPFWLDFVFMYEGDYVAGIDPSEVASPGKARGPSPADGSVVDTTQVMLQWKAGGLATSHNVYFGESLDEVTEGTVEPVTTGAALLMVGADAPLTPGKTYYWRVDEVNDVHPDSPWEGDVWSFLVRPLTAWHPAPGDGALYVLLDQDLTWEPGTGVLFHTVYFDESFEAVSAGTATSWMTLERVYDPGTLEINKTYYWRVDEFTGLATNRGEVWSFTTVPDVAVTDPDLVGWWTLDEGVGTTAVDWSGHGNHGAILGGAQWTYGVFGSALALDGSDDYVEIPHDETLTVDTEVTVMAWINAERHTGPGGAGWQGILGKGNNVRSYSFYTQTDGTLHFSTAGVGSSSTEGVPLNEWVHVAAMVVGGQHRYFIDGQPAGEGGTGVVLPGMNDTASVRIGATQESAREFLGMIDDARIYNQALSAAEVMAIMRGDPLLAWDPSPGQGAIMDIRDVSMLSWLAGDTAVSHDVYLGTDRAAVVAADTDAPEYQGNQPGTSFSLAGIVELGNDYSWRIDEVEADGTVHAGGTWTFTILPHLVVEDFESYDDDIDGGTAIFQTWIDGVENGTGSYVGYEVANNGTFCETRIVHGGGQSMPMEYDNTAAPGISEADRTFVPAQDWTANGVTTLVIHFRGSADNTGQLYAKINGTKVPYAGDPGDIASTRWIAWEIDLASVGVNLASVSTLTIGVEGGGAGLIYVDDIWLTN